MNINLRIFAVAVNLQGVFPRGPGDFQVSGGSCMLLQLVPTINIPLVSNYNALSLGERLIQRM